VTDRIAGAEAGGDVQDVGLGRWSGLRSRCWSGVVIATCQGITAVGVPSYSPKGIAGYVNLLDSGPVTGTTAINELVDNRSGVPVFSDAQGHLSPAQSARIPYATAVQMLCKVPNHSEITSASYWYKVKSPSLGEGYLPADVMSNGDPFRYPRHTHLR
jgi:hypothetical protein